MSVTAEETPVEPATEPVEPVEPTEEPSEPIEPAPEPEAAPEQPAALSEKELEAMFGKLEKEAAQHRKRLDLILGEDALTLEVCPLCSPATAGFYFPVEVDDERRAAVLAALNIGGAPEMLQDPEAELCTRCNGYGSTLTGSLVPGNDTKPCGACTAKGWTNPQERATIAATQGAQAAVAELKGSEPVAPAPTTTLPPFDAWGRALGHVRYGVNPVYATQEQRVEDGLA